MSLYVEQFTKASASRSSSVAAMLRSAAPSVSVSDLPVAGSELARPRTSRPFRFLLVSINLNFEAREEGMKQLQLRHCLIHQEMEGQREAAAG